ncbi:MAG TPA: SDR family NAD(P)-dependent oxidoreductase [Ktedonobacterales bacterium]|nr:SDR family NAD(P)-dependent oxidoreductase [Ktedonobacterales bacterium]
MSRHGCSSDNMKRCMDVGLAVGMLLAVMPLLLLIACAIVIDDRGPIIYRGQRVGRGGVPFSIMKFRTMRTRQTMASQITLRHDPRVTRVGRLLRATKLDELPQLLNVLCGEMSLIGPRPEAPCYVSDYTPEQRAVLAVRPGITGAAQVFFRHEEHMLSGANPERYYRSVVMPAKLAIDLEYVRRRSLWLDLKILALTLVALVRPVAPLGLLPQAEPLPATALITSHAIPGGSLQMGQKSSSRTFAGPAAAPARFCAAVKAWVNYHLVRRVVSYGGAVALDVVTVLAAFETATLLRFMDAPQLEAELRVLFWPDLAIGGIYAVISYLIGQHRTLWRYASIKDGIRLFQAVGITLLLVNGLEIAGTAQLRVLPISVNIVGGLLSFLFLGCLKMSPRVVLAWRLARSRERNTRVLIVGAGDAGARLASSFLIRSMQAYEVVAFVDDDQTKWQRCIHHIPILGPIAEIPQVVKRYGIDLIAIASPAASPERISEIITLCQQTPASIKILPSLHEMLDEQSQALALREVNVADLLGREIVPLQTAEAQTFLEGKVILVTGAAGSIGSELCRQLITYKPAKLIALDNNETGLFDLAESLRTYAEASRLLVRIGDITNIGSMAALFAETRPHLVFHAAAYKHVPLLEEHPDQAIQTNVLGTYALCHLARRHGVGCFVFISSDKAADPINVLGASKRLGERIIQALARSEGHSTRFCAVRFGNVIGSRGSVIPTFLKQIEQGGPVTVTDPETTRYFMTIPEACGLVILTSTMADSGGMFLLDMGRPVRIADLAVKMIRSRGLRLGRDIPIVYSGLRPGERLHELLVAPDEQLLPTSQSKISHILYEEEPQPLADIDHWIGLLQHSLGYQDSASLRGLLLDMARSKQQRLNASGEVSESMYATAQ